MGPGGGIEICIAAFSVASSHAPSRAQLSNGITLAVVHWLANWAGVDGVPKKQSGGPSPVLVST